MPLFHPSSPPRLAPDPGLEVAAGANAGDPGRRGRSSHYEPPPVRRLRGYSFDPSLSSRLETALVNERVYTIPWEDTEPGPVGEYLEVVDHDPASGCWYAPVDIDDPHLLAQDGLAPASSNPQFHQQMTYAVAMTTIKNFERALGRPAVWSSRFRVARDGEGGGSKLEETYVRRLRVYPHGLRDANAYYSPAKKALLFGYFPAAGAGTPRSPQYPGGLVFTCLSHDIIAHETTHALLDGIHPRFMEVTRPDGLAFHEAFADLVALFQHFTFPEVLRHQITQTRGDLETENLLGALAQEFGRATGGRSSLRDALGGINPKTGRWERGQPDPRALERELEPHGRGAILVAAVFDAFLAIYQNRIADLKRIASGGSGILPAGELHPDLVGRFAAEAAKSAQHVLTMCIRALDYCPPVDITFGDYLRALITADRDVVPDDTRGYRVAFIDAFRNHGIYPRGLRALSEDSLRWDPVTAAFERSDSVRRVMDFLKSFLQQTALIGDRAERWRITRESRRQLHHQLMARFRNVPEFARATGLDFSPLPGNAGLHFEVHALWPLQRQRPDGTTLSQVVLSLLQRKRISRSGDAFDIWGGCTVIVDSGAGALRYIIRQSVGDETSPRVRQAIRNRSSPLGASLRDTYSEAGGGTGEEPFALLHAGH